MFVYTGRVREDLKSVEWLGDSLSRVRSFSTEARQKIGFELRQVQRGLDPTDWKPLKIVGSGVREIRVHAESEHRVLYVAKFDDAVYVLHAIVKKTRKTPQEAIRLAQARYRELIENRAGHEA
jgi:phage-related protein